jgi:histidyl-tRNA synthetase
VGDTKAKLKALKGMSDILPDQAESWRKVESVCAELFNNYGYRQIRTPIMESTSLFSRSIGEETDIVSKEMYTFADRNDKSVTLRPEGTASCVRAGIEHGLFHNQLQRLWYVGPMFRYERPQKGRYRQFHQIGVETYGWSSVDIEAEVIVLTQAIWQALDLKKTNLEINSLGSKQSRAIYRDRLVEYLSDYSQELDADSQRRLTSNPLRILDSKVPSTQEIVASAPSILDCLDNEDSEKFDQLMNYLDGLGVKYTVNPRLVRGLDYYNNTVFEWVTEDFGAQSTVCAGGRYDGLVEQLGGAATPAFGFALGMERLIQILQEQASETLAGKSCAQVYIISSGDGCRAKALQVAQELTAAGIKVQTHCGDGSIKNQFKKADKSGAALAVVIGEAELEKSVASLKALRGTLASSGSASETMAQQEVPYDQLLDAVTRAL